MTVYIAIFKYDIADDLAVVPEALTTLVRPRAVAPEVYSTSLEAPEATTETDIWYLQEMATGAVTREFWINTFRDIPIPDTVNLATYTIPVTWLHYLQNPEQAELKK